MLGRVYCYRCRLCHTVTYVGQTTQTLKKRHQQHLSHAGGAIVLAALYQDLLVERTFSNRADLNEEEAEQALIHGVPLRKNLSAPHFCTQEALEDVGLPDGARALIQMAAAMVRGTASGLAHWEGDDMDGFYPGTLEDSPGATVLGEEVFAAYEADCDSYDVPMKQRKTRRSLYAALDQLGVQRREVRAGQQFVDVRLKRSA